MDVSKKKFALVLVSIFIFNFILIPFSGVNVNAESVNGASEVSYKDGEILLYSTFNEYSKTTKPQEYNVLDKGNIIQVDNVPDQTNKSLRMTINKEGDMHLDKHFTANPLTGKFVIEYKFSCEDMNVDKSLLLRDPSGKILNIMTIAQDGSINVAGGTVAEKYRIGKWYHIALAVDLTKRQFDCYVNGEKKVEAQPIEADGFEKVATLRFYISNGTDTKNSTIYFDDISVYTGNNIKTPEDFKAYELSQVVQMFPSEQPIKDRMKDAVALLVGSSAAYNKGVKTKIDEKNENIKPIVKDGRTLVPVRFVAEKLGAKVDWNASTSGIEVAIGNNVVKMKLGSRNYSINNVDSVLEVPAESIDGRTFIPLRALVEAIGKKIFWDEKGLIVISDQDNIFDSGKDADKIKELVNTLKYERPSADQIINDLKAKNPSNKHPRLLATKETFENITLNLKTDSNISSWFDNVIKSADAILIQEPAKFEIPDGLRLLTTSRKVLNRAQVLAMAYKITMDKKYAERLWKELEAVSNFPSWNAERHFLDPAEMCAGVSIAYDWLYEYWSREQRAIIRTAIKEKALIPALEAYHGTLRNGWWVTTTSNWNVVCNSGIAMGALALGEEDTKLTGEILSFGFRSLENTLSLFAPDGAWSEGPAYWQYTISYLTYYLASLNTALGTDYGYFNIDGIDNTGYFATYMSGPKGMFNIHDTDNGTINSPQLFWFANKLNNPDLAGLRIIAMNDYKLAGGVNDLLWYNKDICNFNMTIPLDGMFRDAEIATFRSAWGDKGATFVGIHGGYNTAYHGNLDMGTFVLDALGERWAEDLGTDDYNLPGYFDKERWDYYRIRAEGQNTLVLNPGKGPDQDKEGFGKIIKYESKPQGGFAIVDIASAFPKIVSSAKRGLKLDNNRQTITLQDEVEAIKPSEYWWFMHTKAKIDIDPDGKSAILSKTGKKLLVKLVSPLDATFEIMDALPLSTSPHPEKQNANSDLKKLAIHIKNKKSLNLSVQFIALSQGDEAPTKFSDMQPLEEWSIPDGEIDIPRLSNITIDGKDLVGFSPNRFNYSLKLPADAVNIPDVKAESDDDIFITQAEATQGKAKIEVVKKDNPEEKKVYIINFNVLPMIGKAPDDAVQYQISKVEASAIPQPENSPENTIDNDLATRWSADGEQWIQYDLGSEKNVKYASLSWLYGDERITFFDISVSTDGVNWKYLYNGESSGITSESEIYTLPITSARYIRISGHGNSSNPWNSLNEFSIYGE